MLHPSDLPYYSPGLTWWILLHITWSNIRICGRPAVHHPREGDGDLPSASSRFSSPPRRTENLISGPANSFLSLSLSSSSFFTAARWSLLILRHISTGLLRLWFQKSHRRFGNIFNLIARSDKTVAKACCPSVHVWMSHTATTGDKLSEWVDPCTSHKNTGCIISTPLSSSSSFWPTSRRRTRCDIVQVDL